MADNYSVEQFQNDRVSDPSSIDIGKNDWRMKNVNAPLDGYHISDQETGTTSYFGYLNADGKWYIQRGIRSGAEVNYTYKKGNDGYNWSQRAAGTYASFDTTF